MRFAQAARVTLHVKNHYGVNAHHIAETCFKAVARALRDATENDPRAGKHSFLLPKVHSTLSFWSFGPFGHAVMIYTIYMNSADAVPVNDGVEDSRFDKIVCYSRINSENGQLYSHRYGWRGTGFGGHWQSIYWSDFLASAAFLAFSIAWSSFVGRTARYLSVFRGASTAPVWFGSRRISPS